MKSGLKEVLGLELWLDMGILRFFDPTTGQYLLSYQEAEQARRAAETRGRQEATARETALRRAYAFVFSPLRLCAIKSHKRHRDAIRSPQDAVQNI
jgi:hypothetical protein